MRCEAPQFPSGCFRVDLVLLIGLWKAHVEPPGSLVLSKSLYPPRRFLHMLRLMIISLTRPRSPHLSQIWKLTSLSNHVPTAIY